MLRCHLTVLRFESRMTQLSKSSRYSSFRSSKLVDVLGAATRRTAPQQRKGARRRDRNVGKCWITILLRRMSFSCFERRLNDLVQDRVRSGTSHSREFVDFLLQLTEVHVLGDLLERFYLPDSRRSRPI